MKHAQHMREVTPTDDPILQLLQFDHMLASLAAPEPRADAA
jgi:hypothetical protein